MNNNIQLLYPKRYAKLVKTVNEKAKQPSKKAAFTTAINAVNTAINDIINFETSNSKKDLERRAFYRHQKSLLEKDVNDFGLKTHVLSTPDEAANILNNIKNYCNYEELLQEEKKKDDLEPEKRKQLDVVNAIEDALTKHNAFADAAKELFYSRLDLSIIYQNLCRTFDKVHQDYIKACNQNDHKEKALALKRLAHLYANIYEIAQALVILYRKNEIDKSIYVNDSDYNSVILRLSQTYDKLVPFFKQKKETLHPALFHSATDANKHLSNLGLDANFLTTHDPKNLFVNDWGGVNHDGTTINEVPQSFTSFMRADLFTPFNIARLYTLRLKNLFHYLNIAIGTDHVLETLTPSMQAGSAHAQTFNQFTTTFSQSSNVFSWLSWMFYLPRLANNLFWFAKHVAFQPFWDEGENQFGIKNRMWDELYKRGEQLSNDIVWIAAGLTTHLWITGLPGMWVTAGLYIFDVINMYIFSRIKKQRMKSIINEYDTDIQELKDTMDDTNEDDEFKLFLLKAQRTQLIKDQKDLEDELNFKLGIAITYMFGMILLTALFVSSPVTQAIGIAIVVLACTVQIVKKGHEYYKQYYPDKPDDELSINAADDDDDNVSLEEENESSGSYSDEKLVLLDDKQTFASLDKSNEAPIEQGCWASMFGRYSPANGHAYEIPDELKFSLLG